MTKCAFFDDEQPTTHGLPQWATILHVSELLDIPRNAVRSAVLRAVANNEDWVKKEAGEDGSTHYLIDTTHEVYEAHAQRWNQNRVIWEEEFAASSPAWHDAGDDTLTSTKMASSPSDTPSPPFAQRNWGQQDHSGDDVLQRWTKFRQRLYAWGIQIFQNTLAEEEEENPWQWRWGMLHGDGYSNQEEAIIAAIESRLVDFEEFHEDLTFGTSSLFPQPPLPAPGKAQRFKLFHKRNDFPPF